MISVLDVDGVTPLTEIALGDFVHGQVKTFPGGGDQYPLPLPHYFINNTDEMPWYIGMSVKDKPDDVNFYLHLKKGNETAYQMIGQGGVYSKLIESSHTNPDPNTQFAHWWLHVSVGQSAEFGDFTPIMVIEARDSL